MSLPIIVMGIIRRLVRITGRGSVLNCTLIIVVVTVLMTHCHKNPCEHAESQKQLSKIRHTVAMESKSHPCN